MARNTPEYKIGESYWIRFSQCDIDIMASNIDSDYIEFDGSKDFYYRIGYLGGEWIRVIGGTYSTIRILESDDVTIELFGDATSLMTISNEDVNAEIVGVYKSNNLSDDDVWNEFLKGLFMVHPIVCELYTFDGEQNQVDKASDLTIRGYYIGAFREECEILTPSVLFEFNSFPIFNYVFIPSLSRFYFVTNITCVRSNLYRVDMKIDVLYSYMDDIYNQSGFIARNENSYSTHIIDERLPISYEKYETTGDVQTAYGTPSSDNAINVTFGFDFSGTDYVYLLDCISNLDVAYYNQLQPPTKLPLYPKISSIKVANNMLYVMEYTTMIQFVSGIFKDSSLASYVNSFLVFPFDITTITTYTNESRLTINDKELDYSDGTFKTPSSVNVHADRTRALAWSSMGYVVVADFTITSYFSDNNAFLNYEPYSKYELYIPFVGWIELKSVDILDKRLIVYYGVDVSNGFATCYVKQYITQKTIFSTPCQIGIKLPINTSNAEILTREKQNNNLNMMMGLIASGVSVGMGVMMENPIGIVGGVLGAGKTIASYVNKNNMMLGQAQTTFASTDTSAYDDVTKVRFRIYRPTLIPIDDDIYAHYQGYPINQYDELSNYSGYTEIPEIHYIPQSQTNITIREIDEIISLARKGIIL